MDEEGLIRAFMILKKSKDSFKPWWYLDPMMIFSLLIIKEESFQIVKRFKMLLRITGWEMFFMDFIAISVYL